ncbi:MAG: adenosine deaminase, partial [Pseudomonadota bacterium]
MTDWRAVPKIELHLHLEGAAPPELIRQLAAEAGQPLDRVFDANGRYRWTDFTGFLEHYIAACDVLRRPEHFARITTAVLEAQRAEGVVYTEIFVCPAICGGHDAGAWAEHLAAIGEAAAAVEGIEMRVIAQAIRDLGPGRAETAARLAAAGPADLVVGFG